jgi:hypothetical protein
VAGDQAAAVLTQVLHATTHCGCNAITAWTHSPDRSSGIPMTVDAATPAVSGTGVDKRPDAVEYELWSLLPYPVADVVDQFDLEIAYAVGVSGY